MPFSKGASVLSSSSVAASILANASSVGAITVNSRPLSVSTRFTPGVSLPETAWVSVLSIGLFDAAVATGSIDMPETEPGPDGTCSAYAPQRAPTRSAAGWAIAAGDGAGGVMAMLDERGAALPPDAWAGE